MSDGEVEIRTLHDATEMARIGTVFQQVWGTATPIVTVELLMAISHAGGYVAGAFEDDRAIGASFGFLGDHLGERALHSHITGILPGVQHGGVGRQMKEHQRRWAAERSIPWIVWTFDPLVRTNAWFNIEVLGGRITDYLTNFYGRMSDSINAEDESDRLVVAWSTHPDAARPTAPEGSTIQRIETPDDIIRLRRTDPMAATEWRLHLREELAPLIAAGGVVTGFSRDGEYLVASV